jgi:predicted 3-demethylubiquinone-9 3-methyltransferase (glyoxalase superfamily)
MIKGNKIKPFLWFEHQAEEAAKFYTSIFKKSKLGKIARYPDGSPVPAGSVMTIEFQIEGQDFIALNGGKQDWQFNDAISFSVECETQAEIDYYWEKLLAGGGKPVQCGWLKDKYGVSWQVNPTFLGDVFGGKDKAKAQRVMQAMLKMVKLDLKALKEAAK